MKMNVPDFLRQYSAEIGTKHLSTLYRWLWNNVDALEKNGIISVHSVLAKEYIIIEDDVKLLSFILDMKTKMKNRIKSYNTSAYYKPKKKEVDKADETDDVSDEQKELVEV